MASHAFHTDGDGDFDILPGAPARGTARTVKSATSAKAGENVEQVDVVEALEAGAIAEAAGSTEALAPFGRRPEILPRLKRAHLIVGRTLLCVL